MAFYFMPCQRVRAVLRRHRPEDAAPVETTALPTMPLTLIEPPRSDGWAMRLRRHLRWVIGIKLLLIGLLFSLFFSSSHRPAIDAGGVSDRLQLSR